MNNYNFLFVIATEKNILDISLKYCSKMKFIVSSNNTKETKQFYKDNNMNNNLITTLEIPSNTSCSNNNKYDHVFNSIIFFSKIINKMYSVDNIKRDILICISKKYIQRSIILCSYIFKNVSSVKFTYDNNEKITIDHITDEKYHLNLFYQSPYSKN